MTRSDFKQWLYHFKQWLYGGQRPNWIAKILNRARPHVSVNKDAPIAEFEKVAADFPVFRVASHTAVQLTQPC